MLSFSNNKILLWIIPLLIYTGCIDVTTNEMNNYDYQSEYNYPASSIS